MRDKQESLPGLPEPLNEPAEEGKRTAPARLKEVDRSQLLMRTVDVERLIDDEHPARAIWEFVGKLDLSGYTEQIRSVAGSAGRPAFSPRLLVSLWVYSYSRGVSSARAIERLCEHEPAYQWLTGMERINAHTLSNFRVAHEQRLRDLFVQTLGLLSAEGLITLERVMLDGTKIRANASSSGFRRKPRVAEFLEQAREAVEALEAVNEEESTRQVQAAQQRAARERRERLESALKEFDKLKETKSSVDRVSTSDPQARIMKQAEGGAAPSYNVQISTDAANSVIVDIDATQAGSDYKQLKPAMERVEQNLHSAPEQAVVDGGYISASNILEMAKCGIELIGPDSDDEVSADANRRKSYKHRGVGPAYETSKFVYDATNNTCVCPQGKTLRYDAKFERDGTMRFRYKASEQDCQACPAKAECCPRAKHGRAIEKYEPLPDVSEFRQKMKTDEAKNIYRTRSQVAEFPNLWIKTKFGLRQFSVRGLNKVRIESLWAALTYDIQHWIRLRWRPSVVAKLAPT